MVERVLFALLASCLVSSESMAGQRLLVAQGTSQSRSEGSPVREAVNLPAWDGPAQLKLYNGGISGTGRRASSARFWLNGELVVGPASFNQNVHVVDVDVQARFNSTLEIEIASAPGSYLDYELYMVIPDELSSASEAEFRDFDRAQGDGDTLVWLGELGFAFDHAVIRSGTAPGAFAAFTNSQQRVVVYVLDESWPFGLSPVVVLHDESGLLFVKRRGGVLLSGAFAASVLSEAEVATHLALLGSPIGGTSEGSGSVPSVVESSEITANSSSTIECHSARPPNDPCPEAKHQQLLSCIDKVDKAGGASTECKQCTSGFTLCFVATRNVGFCAAIVARACQECAVELGLVGAECLSEPVPCSYDCSLSVPFCDDFYCPLSDYAGDGAGCQYFGGRCADADHELGENGQCDQGPSGEVLCCPGTPVACGPGETCDSIRGCILSNVSGEYELSDLRPSAPLGGDVVYLSVRVRFLGPTGTTPAPAVVSFMADGFDLGSQALTLAPGQTSVTVSAPVSYEIPNTFNTQVSLSAVLTVVGGAAKVLQKTVDAPFSYRRAFFPVVSKWNINVLSTNTTAPGTCALDLVRESFGITGELAAHRFIDGLGRNWNILDGGEFSISADSEHRSDRLEGCAYYGSPLVCSGSAGEETDVGCVQFENRDEGPYMHLWASSSYCPWSASCSSNPSGGLTMGLSCSDGTSRCQNVPRSGTPPARIYPWQPDTVINVPGLTNTCHISIAGGKRPIVSCTVTETSGRLTRIMTIVLERTE